MNAYLIEVIHNVDVAVNAGFFATCAIFARFPETRNKRNYRIAAALLAGIVLIPSQSILVSLFS